MFCDYMFGAIVLLLFMLINTSSIFEFHMLVAAVVMLIFRNYHEIIA